jgi:hypothetical protein
MDPQMLLHPTFLKDYMDSDAGSVYIDMWRMAAEALRSADKVVVIGYSLPPADSAALTLILSNCQGDKTEVVDPDSKVLRKYRHLLKQPVPPMSVLPGQTFADWIAKQKP